MLISHVALVGCIVFNAFTSPSLTHAKPIPCGGQSNALSTLTQVDTESSIPWGLRSTSSQQLWPRSEEATAAELKELIKRAHRLPEKEREQFFLRDMVSQWTLSKDDLDNPHANLQKGIQRAADSFDCLRGLRVLLDQGIEDLPADAAAKIKQKAEQDIDAYAILIVQQPFFPKGCMSPSTAHAILDRIKRNKLQVSVIGFETFVERLENPRAT
ncbi:hypothetical protein H0H93_005984 [Arthromyces matolae]|nr:hypothetical protein H0H93_005984 [Arthromyces matolae]